MQRYFFPKRGRKDGAETGGIEQCDKNGETLLVLNLRVLFNYFLGLLIIYSSHNSRLQQSENEKL